MRYMVVETFLRGAPPVYERVAERGRMLPPGLHYVDSWVDADLRRCFQLMETDDPGLLEEWTREWSDLVGFEVVPLGDPPVCPPHDTSRLFSLLFGGVRARLAYAVVKTGVAGELARGPAELEELASRTGTNRDALERVLRVLAAEGLFEEAAPQTYAATDDGRLLAGSRRYDALLVGEHVDRVFAHAVEFLRTGEPVAARAFGRPYYEWLTEDPAAAAIFNNAMVMGARAALPTLLPLDVWPEVRTVVDVGGGNGTALAALLREHPHLRGTVFDLPHAERDATALLAAEGVGDRGTFESGDFFDAVPAGADVYIAVQVLHNWSDEDAARILANVRVAMPPTGRLLLIEIVAADDRTDTVLADILSLAWLGGKERTAAEWRALLGRAGLTVASITPGDRVSAIEARRD